MDAGEFTEENWERVKFFSDPTWSQEPNDEYTQANQRLWARHLDLLNSNVNDDTNTGIENWCNANESGTISRTKISVKDVIPQSRLARFYGDFFYDNDREICYNQEPYFDDYVEQPCFSTDDQTLECWMLPEVDILFKQFVKNPEDSNRITSEVLMQQPLRSLDGDGTTWNLTDFKLPREQSFCNGVYQNLNNIKAGDSEKTMESLKEAGSHPPWVNQLDLLYPKMHLAEFLNRATHNTSFSYFTYQNAHPETDALDDDLQKKKTRAEIHALYFPQIFSKEEEILANAVYCKTLENLWISSKFMDKHARTANAQNFANELVYPLHEDLRPKIESSLATFNKQMKTIFSSEDPYKQHILSSQTTKKTRRTIGSKLRNKTAKIKISSSVNIIPELSTLLKKFSLFNDIYAVKSIDNTSNIAMRCVTNWQNEQTITSPNLLSTDNRIMIEESNYCNLNNNLTTPSENFEFSSQAQLLMSSLTVSQIEKSDFRNSLIVPDNINYGKDQMNDAHNYSTSFPIDQQILFPHHINRNSSSILVHGGNDYKYQQNIPLIHHTQATPNDNFSCEKSTEASEFKNTPPNSKEKQYICSGSIGENRDFICKDYYKRDAVMKTKSLDSISCRNYTKTVQNAENRRYTKAAIDRSPKNQAQEGNRKSMRNTYICNVSNNKKNKQQFDKSNSDKCNAGMLFNYCSYSSDRKNSYFSRKKRIEAKSKMNQSEDVAVTPITVLKKNASSSILNIEIINYPTAAEKRNLSSNNCSLGVNAEIPSGKRLYSAVLSNTTTRRNHSSIVCDPIIKESFSLSVVEPEKCFTNTEVVCDRNKISRDLSEDTKWKDIERAALEQYNASDESMNNRKWEELEAQALEQNSSTKNSCTSVNICIARADSINNEIGCYLNSGLKTIEKCDLRNMSEELETVCDLKSAPKDLGLDKDNSRSKRDFKCALKSDLSSSSKDIRQKLDYNTTSKCDIINVSKEVVTKCESKEDFPCMSTSTASTIDSVVIYSSASASRGPYKNSKKKSKGFKWNGKNKETKQTEKKTGRSYKDVLENANL